MPFRNLKFFIILNKTLGLISCKLVNGRLKSSNIWSCCWCTLLILFHLIYVCMKYHMMYHMYQVTAKREVKREIVFFIVRFSSYFVSMIPYFFVTIFWSKDFVKLSDKLLAYDEQATALGHQRKDRHIFTYMFFVYTLVTISFQTYYSINNSTLQGIMEILNIFQNITFILTGTYCVLTTCIFLDLIRQRFRHLNEMIVPHVSELPVTGSQNEITVYDVRYLHGMLLSSAEQINSLYGLSTFFTLLSVLLDLVWFIFRFIKDITVGKDIHDNLVEISDVLFQMIYLFAMYHFTTYEANRVEERVIRYGLPFSNKKHRMDKIEMMLYFYHRRYSFTAAEFFPLDLTILIPVATTVITFLTLII